MRMRTDIGLARQARLHQLGSHAVEEDVGADHAALGERQHAADFKGTQVAAALLDDEFDHGKDLRLERGMHDYRTGSTIAGFTRPREVIRKVGRIVLAIRDVPGGSTVWPLHCLESRLLSGGFVIDSLSQAPAHLSGAGLNGIRRVTSDRIPPLLAVA